MKTAIVIISLLFASMVVVGQNGYKAMTDGPVDFQVTGDSLFVTGRWDATDKNDKQSQLAGPSVSEISCERKTATCHELQANMIVVGGDMFSLQPVGVYYTITRWDAKEIVAENTGGICKVRTVLKIELQAKQVHVITGLSEPPDSKLPQFSKDACKMAAMSLELHAETVFSKDTAFQKGVSK